MLRVKATHNGKRHMVPPTTQNFHICSLMTTFSGTSIQKISKI